MTARDSVIAEILGLMEEKRKTKDYLLDQAKIHQIKADPTLNSYEILKKSPASFLRSILGSLRGNDETFDDIHSFAKIYNWFFTDIVASASPTTPTKDQLRKIVVLNELIQRSDVFEHNKEHSALVPTGDGIAIGFPDSSEHPLQLAIDLHKAIHKYNSKRKGKNKIAVRIGLDIGHVYVIKSLTGSDNYWGPGIIMARRIMDTAGDMQIFTSKKFAEDIRKLSSEYQKIFHNIGRYVTKHDEEIDIFNVYGRGFGNKSVPKKTKVIQRRETEKDLRGAASFEFKDIAIELDVTNPKTMMTHHTWTWNIVNISREPRDQVFYYLDGDSPKDFADLGVRVTDEKRKELEILSIPINKPYHKEFNVKLSRPIQPRQQRTIRLEYDWEEPDRNFFYKLATNCKKFQYKFTIPKSVQIKNRILKVDTEMGYKWLASPPPRTIFGKRNTVVTWSAANLKAYDAYRFEW